MPAAGMPATRNHRLQRAACIKRNTKNPFTTFLMVITDTSAISSLECPISLLNNFRIKNARIFCIGEQQPADNDR